VGAAIAYRLAEARLRVTVVEAGRPGSGTTASSLAWLNSFAKEPDHYHRLNTQGIAEHRTLAAEAQAEEFVHLDGGLVWERAGSANDLAVTIERCRRLGYEVEELTPAETSRLEPDLRVPADLVNAVFRVPHEGWLDAPGLTRRLLGESERRLGVQSILGQAVVGFLMEGTTVTGVRLAHGGQVSAGLVVNACGPGAAELAALAGSSLPVGRVLGVVLVTASLPMKLRHVLHPPDLAVRPEGGGRLALRYPGVDETLTSARAFATRDARCAESLRRAGEWIPAVAGGQIEEIRIGVRPMPADRLPIVGPDPEVAGLYHAVTHSGVTLAAVLARLVRDDILGTDPSELEPYRPVRFHSEVMN
jgi:glycine/D-amino acid oxidase-like deaminating enzyme